MVACVLIPRLELSSALSDRREMVGRPVALAPEPGGPQVVGEVSGAAETFGVRRGMRLAEALARCPALVLVAPDPVRAEAVWERTLERLERLGAAIEPARPGEAFFATEPLRALYGDAGAVLARARRELGAGARLGAGPTRLCAHAAARRMRARRPALVVSERAMPSLLAGLPVDSLRDQLADEWDRVSLVDSLERLGVRTLGELARLPAEAVADRFGEPGLLALRLARGGDEPLRPRSPSERLACGLDLPEAASGGQLERALELLVDRLLAHPARGGRTIRRLRLEAAIAPGGGWRTEVTMRSATADAQRLRLALASKLGGLPGPASRLGLTALELGHEAGEQPALARSEGEKRRGRLTEAVRQARAAAGRDAVLQAVDVDPASHVPERRTLLTPFPDRSL